MKKFGLLVPLFSLPSNSGIGEFGYQTEDFLFILNRNKVKLWQLLPISPINQENSPYSALSSYGIDPIYISLEKLQASGYVFEIDLPTFDTTRVNYNQVRAYKEPYLRAAFSQFKKEDNTLFLAFLNDHQWAHLVADFLAKYQYFNGSNWNTWPKTDASFFEEHPELKEEIYFQEWLQYIAMQQYDDIKNLAHMLDIELVGDVPFYPGFNSVEVMNNQDMFLLDQNLDPVFVAGVPPDYFSKTGQNWKNPIWNWDKLATDNYALYNDRLGYISNLFDYVRLDHFRALDTYYIIPGKDETAVHGHWRQLDGGKVLESFFQKYPKAQVLVEDLGGDMNERIPALRDRFHLPGMKQLEFSIFSDFHLGENFVRYTGTHDNAPLKEWYKSTSTQVKTDLDVLLKKAKVKKTNRTRSLIRYFQKYTTLLGIISIVDILELTGPENRINTPGTVSPNNWSWRVQSLHNLNRKLKKYCFDC